VPVVAVTESQTVDATGQLTDVYEITATLENRPGSFTFTVPKAGDPVAAARAELDRLDAEVTGLYAL
jgi:hypothetical protein